MAHVVTVVPEGEPVTLKEVKAALRLPPSQTIHNDTLERLITGARQAVEENLSRKLITQTVKQIACDFPEGDELLTLEVGPVVSVESIAYRDADSADQALASTAYRVGLVATPARIQMKAGNPWPETDGELEAVAVTFVAGYGEASAVPGPIKEAIIRLVDHNFNRTGVADAPPFGALIVVPEGFMTCLDYYRWDWM